jgi:transcriptional regulator with XRE-family HTH domain
MNPIQYLSLQELGTLARQVRESAGLTQAEAAQRIGSSQSNVSAAEQDNSTRYVTVALKLIEELGSIRVEGPFYGIPAKKEEEG